MRLTANQVPIYAPIAAAAVLTFAGAPAMAQADPTTLELARGCGGPLTAQGGAGNEQPSVAHVRAGDQDYVVVLSMTSDVHRPDDPAECELEEGQEYEESELGPWQCKCTSIRMDPDGPTVAAQQIVTDYNGTRPCNHPKLASSGSTVLATFGSDHDDRANVATYAGVLDHTCSWIRDPIENRISRNENNNEGAPDVLHLRDDLWVAGYLSQASTDRSHALLLQADTATGEVRVLDDDPVVEPADIGRPTLVKLNDGQAIFCSAKGANRPPEDGVECALLEVVEGTPEDSCGQEYCLERAWRRLIAASNANEGIYANQPQLAPNLFPGGKVALLYTYSMGRKRNGDDEDVMALSRTEVVMMQPDVLGPNVQGTAEAIGVHQTHATLCSGMWGDADSPRVYGGVFDASITGSGLGAIAFFDETLQSLGSRVVSGRKADSGQMAHQYGQNPNTQGRDFLRCIGNVPNAGYGVAGGFRPEVETFWVLPFGGNIPGQPKNALFASFMPATSSDPEPLPEEPPDVVVDPGATDDGGTGEPDGGAPGTSPPSDTEEEPDTIRRASRPTTTSDGSGCALGGAIPASGGHGLAFIAAIALLLRVRGSRRRRDRRSRRAHAPRRLVRSALAGLLLGGCTAPIQTSYAPGREGGGDAGIVQLRPEDAATSRPDRSTESPPETEGPDAAAEYYQANVHRVLALECATCHAGSNIADGPDFMGLDPAASSFREVLLADAEMVGETPATSLLLTKGAHAGRAFTEEEGEAVAQWIRMERSGEPVTPMPSEDGGAPPSDEGHRPVTLDQALQRFAACMEATDWRDTEAYSVAMQDTAGAGGGGPCFSCHGGGMGGAFLSEDMEAMFRNNRHRPYVLKLVTGTVNPDGSFDDLVMADRFADKGREAETCEANGGGAACHPVYILSDERRAALDEFLERTLARYHDYTLDCASE